MHLTRMRLGGVPPFTEPVEFEFDERVNVFVGPNASGKSTLLREINLAFDRESWNDTISHRILEGMRPPTIWHYSELEQDSEYLEKGKFNFVSLRSDSGDDYCSEAESPVIHFGPVRIGLSESEIGERTDLDGTPARELLMRGFSGENLRMVFDQSQIEADRMFDEERQLRESGVEDFERRAWIFFSVDELAYKCAKSICNEIITGDRPRNYVAGLNLEDLEHQPMANFEDVSIRRSLGIGTIDAPNFDNVKPEHRPVHSGKAGSEPLDASFLSSGTQLTLLWIWWLALKMLHHYEFMDDWHERPAILLIDEIENHLHPTWQRRVIPALLEHFPGLQIFATTHSPFVVAGLKKGQVHRLYRDEEGIVRAEPPNDVDIMGWTMDEILRGFMGVQDPTDDETARNAAELRRLRDEGPRDTEDAEAARQAEMNNLRRKVDRDLLAGAPMAARRELFEQQFNEALEKYRLSQDLGQDSG